MAHPIISKARVDQSFVLRRPRNVQRCADVERRTPKRSAFTLIGLGVSAANIFIIIKKRILAKMRPHSGRATLITELMGEGLSTAMSMKYEAARTFRRAGLIFGVRVSHTSTHVYRQIRTRRKNRNLNHTTGNSSADISLRAPQSYGTRDTHRAASKCI